MTLNAKIIVAVAAAVVITTAGATTSVYFISKSNRFAAIRDSMEIVLQQAAGMKGQMDQMYADGAFDLPKLKADAVAVAAREGKPLKDVYAQTSLYRAIPVVASWQAAEQAAKKNGFTFEVASVPGKKARKPEHDRGNQYQAAFDAFRAGETKYFTHDQATNELVLVQAVTLNQSCLACHGDPSQSPTKDGLDVVGFPLDNMKAGEVIGAFVMRAPVSDDPVIAKTMIAVNVVGVVLLIATIGAFVYFTRRFISKPLAITINQIDDASEEVADAAGEISKSSASLAENASAQAAALEEISASLEEMSSMTKRNAESAAAAKDAAGGTRHAADAGAKLMEDMHASVNAIQDSSQEITKILKTIDEIAFQTNILALNAAVEAARAGSAGAGFAVVADEVRNLAQRSATAAKETALKIDDCVTKSGEGARITQQVKDSFADIRTRVLRLDGVVAEIATASHEQSQGITQVTEAIADLDRTTQSGAATSEESAAAAHELHAQSQLLNEAMTGLHQITGVSVHHSAHSVKQRVAEMRNATHALPPPKPGLQKPTLRPNAGKKSPPPPARVRQPAREEHEAAFIDA